MIKNYVYTGEDYNNNGENNYSNIQLIKGYYSIFESKNYLLCCESFINELKDYIDLDLGEHIKDDVYKNYKIIWIKI